MAELTAKEAADWLASATDLRAKYADFQARRAQLAAMQIDPKKNPKLYAERASLLKRANETNAKISGIVSTVENLYASVKGYAVSIGNALTFSPYEWARDQFKGQFGLNGLGVLPALIPVAVIVTAVAGIVFWTRDSILFFQKVQEQQRLEASGMSPEQAAALVEAKAEESITSSIGGALKFVIIGGALWFGFQYYQKRKGK